MKPRAERVDRTTTVPHGAKRTRPRRLSRWALRTAAALVVGGLLLATVLRFGGRLVVITDTLPEQADVAIVLNGSEAGVTARLAAAMRLLEEGRVAHVMLSVGATSYYGEWIPGLVRRFVQREYGDTLAAQVLICEGLADSTGEEMLDLRRCLQPTGWRSAVIVTSDYHTRRARMIVRSTLVGHTSLQRFAVYGVPDGSFVARGWWKRRRYAKTWLLETMKLLSSFVEQWLPGGVG